METPAADDEEPFICLGGCGHTLTSPASLARGYGSDCWHKLHGRTTPKPRRHTPTAKPGPGQDELPLQDQLELWTSP